MKNDPFPNLTPQDLQDLTAWRHRLHQAPEVSGHEAATAQAVMQALAPLSPTQIVSGLGGHGVAAVFAGSGPGPTVMIRAELDALPIPESPGPAYISRHPGVAHLCGHDGHMATLIGVARLLSRRPPQRGRAVLMFQPSEENGAGAAAVLADPAFAPLRPDWAFALHNMPGLPLGQVQVVAGPANCASVGLCLRLSGRTAHAATPETGLSPARAMADLIPALGALGTGGALGPDFRLVTLTHARLGEPAFGISPSEAEVWATLRTLQDHDMADLKDKAVALAKGIAAQHGLRLALSWHDDFAACVNDAEAVAHIQAVTDWVAPMEPMRASEDFGRFRGPQTRSAMFLLGAGHQTPALHSPDYDFPDVLIGQGAAIFRAILRDILG
jgi:amidohydrolase